MTWVPVCLAVSVGRSKARGHTHSVILLGGGRHIGGISWNRGMTLGEYVTGRHLTDSCSRVTSTSHERVRSRSGRGILIAISCYFLPFLAILLQLSKRADPRNWNIHNLDRTKTIENPATMSRVIQRESPRIFAHQRIMGWTGKEGAPARVQQILRLVKLGTAITSRPAQVCLLFLARTSIVRRQWCHTANPSSPAEYGEAC